MSYLDLKTCYLFIYFYYEMTNTTEIHLHTTVRSCVQIHLDLVFKYMWRDTIIIMGWVMIYELSTCFFYKFQIINNIVERKLMYLIWKSDTSIFLTNFYKEKILFIFLRTTIKFGKQFRRYNLFNNIFFVHFFKFFFDNV
jgi:hypothetical protein